MAAHHHFEHLLDGNWGWIVPIAVVLHLMFWIFLVWLVVRVVGPWVRSRPLRGPERVLAERFADGSLTEEEYRTRLAVLRAARP